ncbi:MAG: lipid A deacylase LpxR family protein [Akkermansiaceae bacterium]
MKKSPYQLSVTALATGICLSSLSAQDTAPLTKRSMRDGSWTMYVDNDLFNGTDEYYTNGFRFAYLSDDRRADELPWGFKQLSTVLPGGFSSDATFKNYGISLGQSMFTPADTEIGELQLEDRPYAAWLYLGLSLQAKTESELDLLELSVGVIGPSALGEQAQDIVHNLISSDLAQGWDNQLDDALAINLYYQKKWREKYPLSRTNPRGWAFSLHRNAGFSLGTVHVDANVGAAIRFGYNLPDDFGSNRISPTAYVQPSPSRRDTDLRGWGFYVFTGFDGFARAHNAFLDGGPYRDGLAVDKRTFVGELEAGFAVTRNNWRVTYTQVFRTDEFTNQDTSGQNFGTLAFSYRF